MNSFEEKLFKCTLFQTVQTRAHKPHPHFSFILKCRTFVTFIPTVRTTPVFQGLDVWKHCWSCLFANFWIGCYQLLCVLPCFGMCMSCDTFPKGNRPHSHRWWPCCLFLQPLCSQSQRFTLLLLPVCKEMSLLFLPLLSVVLSANKATNSPTLVTWHFLTFFFFFFNVYTFKMKMLQ